MLVFPALPLDCFAFAFPIFQCGRVQDVEMIPIKADSRGWCLSDRSLHFASVVDLVMHYQKNSLKEVSTVLDIALTYPIKRAEVCTYACAPFDYCYNPNSCVSGLYTIFEMVPGNRLLNTQLSHFSITPQ